MQKIEHFYEFGKFTGPFIGLLKCRNTTKNSPTLVGFQSTPFRLHVELFGSFIIFTFLQTVSFCVPLYSKYSRLEEFCVCDSDSPRRTRLKTCRYKVTKFSVLLHYPEKCIEPAQSSTYEYVSLPYIRNFPRIHIPMKIYKRQLRFVVSVHLYCRW